MSHIRVALFPVFLMAFISFGSTGKSVTEVVKDVDLKKYAGTWYEIARFPNNLEKELVEVTSTFKHTKNGRYEVVNSGYKGSRGGKRSTIKCNVHVPDPDNTGAMKVRAFIFSFDYRIIDVDRENYQFALVTTNSDKFLWVMSKTPTMNPRDYGRMVESARKKGYDIGRLEMVPQESNSALAER